MRTSGTMSTCQRNGGHGPPSPIRLCDIGERRVNMADHSPRSHPEATVNNGQTQTDAQGKRRKRYSAPALEKGLDILELLSSEPEGLNITQLATRLGRSVGEVFRMIAVLEQRGYIHSREGSDAYRITLKLFELAHKISPVARLGSVAAPELKNLSHRIGQSSHVVIYYDGRGHVVVQQNAPSERILSVRLGAEAPLLDTCSGHVLLAFASSQERTLMIGEIPRRHRKPRSAELAELVARIGNAGCEAMESAQVRGVKDIGFPIFDHTGEIAAALVVPFLAYRDDSHPIDFDEAKRQTARSARALSEALGHAGGDSATG